MSVFECILDYTTHKFAKCYVRDIERKTGLDHDTVFAEISRLVAEGFITRSKSAIEPYVRRLPRVGDKATYSIGSDSYSYNIVKVSKSGKTFEIDMVRRRNWPDEQPTTVVRQSRKDPESWRVSGGCGCVTPGLDKNELDPHF